MFFTFAAIMNFIPFRLVELTGRNGEWMIGWVYSGYLMGIVTALLAVKIKTLCGNEYRVMMSGFIIYSLSLFLLGLESIPVLFGGMFVFCGAMFLIHATASGLLNNLTDQNRGMVNGVYVSCYYGGGTLGSILPGYIYRGFGWNGLLILLTSITACGLVCILFSMRSTPSKTVRAN